MKHFKKLSLLILILNIVVLIDCLGPYPNAPEHTIKPRLKSTKKYTPTNSWFENLLLNKGESAIQTYPYIVKSYHKGLSLSYAGRLINEKSYILEPSVDNLIFTIRESFPESLIDQSSVDADFFGLSVKINYGSKFNVILVRGSASVISNYQSVTPVFKTIHAILNIPNSPIKGRSLKLVFNNGQTWIIQSETEITWIFSGSEVSAQSSYTGWLKISIAVSDEAEKAFNIYGDLAPITNGQVKYNVDRTKSPEITVEVEYNNEGLFYLLPHVYLSNQTGAKIIKGAIAKGVKGTYLLASGKSYNYLVKIHSSSKRDKVLDSQEKREELLKSLKEDSSKINITSKDPYFGGKELARAGQLLEIADFLNDTQSKNKIKDALVKELDDYWFGISNNKPNLMYEPTWGGIVSRGSVGSAEADFGQYYFNDHHFHYGYFINVAATLAKIFPDYYNSRKEYFKIILADFAGTCNYDGLPCGPRAKDPFLGHTYAAGIFEFADSRNQESTAESCNAYYAVRELGKVTGDEALEDLGDYLLSTEILATKTYWHIKKNSNIYDPPFSENGVVGIIWETKADYATFFGLNVEFIYGIQMLPFNDISEQYLDREWLEQTRKIWAPAIDRANIEEGWKGFLLLADSVVNPSRIGLSKQVHELKSYDNGNSRTNTLYFYYLMGGSHVNTLSNETIPTSTNTPTSSLAPSELNDTGKPTPLCGAVDYGCFNQLESLIGCYNPSSQTCFVGGNICPKPLLACINPSNIVQGVPCYDKSQYKCENGNLYFIG